LPRWNYVTWCALHVVKQQYRARNWEMAEPDYLKDSKKYLDYEEME
jgi:hypothetical protein